MFFKYSIVCMYVCECATITLKQNVQYIARIRAINLNQYMVVNITLTNTVMFV